MRRCSNILHLLIAISLLLHFTYSFAKIADTNVNNIEDDEDVIIVDEEDPVCERSYQENKILPYYGITFYKPTYVMPYYYTGSPYNKIYRNNTPQNESIKHAEMKYQLSFKVPIWRSLCERTSLYLAYTQLSYWQAYNRTAFFRETDYEPELFLANQVNSHIFRSLHINFVNVGIVHQSNGYGSHLERSWNRLYVEVISTFRGNNLIVSIKPWIVIPDPATRYYNPNITNYLGYGQILIAYKFCNQVISVQAHNLIEGGGRHATAEISWSFPITPYLNGYVQAFSGYGQSLIEYDHHTNSAGIGLALSNWI